MLRLVHFSVGASPSPSLDSDYGEGRFTTQIYRSSTELVYATFLQVPQLLPTNTKGKRESVVAVQMMK